MISLVWWGKASDMDGGWLKAVIDVIAVLRCMQESNPASTSSIVKKTSKQDPTNTGHDSVIYSRSERPADSVHLHARSVPANLGRRISERMGRLTLGPYWPASRSKCVGRVSRFKCTG